MTVNSETFLSVQRAQNKQLLNVHPSVELYYLPPNIFNSENSNISFWIDECLWGPSLPFLEANNCLWLLEQCVSFYLMVYPFKVKEFQREKSLTKGIGSAYNHKTLYIYMQIFKIKDKFRKANSSDQYKCCVFSWSKVK